MESLVEFYVHENMQLLEELENILLDSENINGILEKQHIQEVFRVMHTIKGSSSMMGYESLTKLSHSIEDVFDEIRNGLELSNDEWREVIDLVLLSIDFFKNEISLINENIEPQASIEELNSNILNILSEKNKKVEVGQEKVEQKKVEQKKNNNTSKEYYINIFFEEDCGMESVRAFGVLNSIEQIAAIKGNIPEDLTQDSDEFIVNNGLMLHIVSTEEKESIESNILGNMFIKTVEIEAMINSEEEIYEECENLELIEDNEDVLYFEEEIVKEIEIEEVKEEVESEIKEEVKEEIKEDKKTIRDTKKNTKNEFLSVNVDKVDKLMNLVGEIVTTESMVGKHTEVETLNQEDFEKQSRRLNQLTNELQDVVMSIRMVPIASIFTKMQRIVRDMNRKTGKSVELIIKGQDTEVDKNIIENISDPLMHMIRNSIDHGIETQEVRISKSKPTTGKIMLEAKNTGSEIIIIIQDDGKGLDKESIIKKAIDKGITNKEIDEISDKEAYNFILKPDFSTNDVVTEYSGRGVGMDVVYTNISKMRGTINIESEEDRGTKMIINIPLTLAIIDGMKVKTNDDVYIIPSLNIKEVMIPGSYKIATNPNGTEYSIIREQCYNIQRLSNILGEKSNKEEIMILLESELGTKCLMVDSILGRQQVVIKSIPSILSKIDKIKRYLVGCSIMEDGNINLILDINEIINKI